MERNAYQNFNAFGKTEIKFKSEIVHTEHSPHGCPKRIIKSTDETTKRN